MKKREIVRKRRIQVKTNFRRKTNREKEEFINSRVLPAKQLKTPK